MEQGVLTETELSSGLSRQRILAINSTVYFVLAYLFIYVLQQAATIFAARTAQIPMELFPGHIQFKIADSQWQKSDVILTYAAGPVVCLLAAIICLIFLNRAINSRSGIKLFFLWAAIHGLNIFLGSLLAGCIVQGGFWFAVQWLVINYGMVWVIGGILGLLLVISGILLAPSFLLTCDSLTLLEFPQRRKLLTISLVAPFIFGSLFIVLLKIPDFKLYEGLQLMTLLLFLTPAYFQNLKNHSIQPIVSPKRPSLASGVLFVAIFAALVFRLALQNGISFY